MKLHKILYNWIFRIHFPSIKDYSFKPKTNYQWGQYVLIDEPSYLNGFVDYNDRIYTTFCCSRAD